MQAVQQSNLQQLAASVTALEHILVAAHHLTSCTTWSHILIHLGPSWDCLAISTTHQHWDCMMMLHDNDNDSGLIFLAMYLSILIWSEYEGILRIHYNSYNEDMVCKFLGPPLVY